LKKEAIINQQLEMMATMMMVMVNSNGSSGIGKIILQ